MKTNGIIHISLATSLFALVAVTTTLVGCGSSKTTKSTASSRGSNTLVNYQPTNSTRLGECNRLSLSSLGITGQVGTYYDPTTRIFRGDYLNLNLTDVPDGIFSTSTMAIQFFRWSVSSTGQKVLNTIPVRFYFVDKLNGISTASNTVDKISKATLTTAKDTLDDTWINVTFEQFFERVMIVLTGVESQYEGLSVALYNTATSTAAIGQSDVLIPAFDANPNTYKTYRPYSALFTLHPNYSYANSNASDSDYFRMIDDICKSLSGVGVRIPASVGSSATEPASLFSRVWMQILRSLELD